VKHHAAIAKFLAEKKATGRFSSERTIVSYRRCLELHAEDANANGHPTVRSVDTGDIVTTLGRWRGQNTKRNRRAILVSYYDWAAANGHRPTNPARSVQAPKRRNNTPPVAGPQEIQAVMAEARRKGGRERWVPAGLAIRAVRDDLRKHRGHPKHHILASSQTVEVGVPEPQMKEDPWRPMSQQALMRLVDRVCGPTGANVRFRMTPQAFRRHYGYVIAQEHGIWVAQAVLGHADVGTTVEHYTGIASESDTNAARKTVDARLNWPGGNGEKEAPTGIEPVHGTGKTRR
jgi:site-specific recombinase XerD